MAEVFSTYEVFTETGGLWAVFDDIESARYAAFMQAEKEGRPFLIRRQDIRIHEPIEIEPSPRLFDD